MLVNPNFKFYAILMIVLSSFSPLAFAGEQLIYNNSNEKNYYVPVARYQELIDYGRSPGGYIKRFRFKYVSESTSSSRITVRFYGGTSSTWKGYQIKSFTISYPPTTYGDNIIDYQIPDDQAFTLPDGDFGYSVSFSSSDKGLQPASGGQESDTYFWYYDDFWNDWWNVPLDGGWGGFYMQIYSGFPTGEDPYACNISGDVFDDENANGIFDASENAISGWDVYLDYDRDGYKDASEPNVLTDPNGMYQFLDVLAPDTYNITPALQDGWSVSYPASGSHTINTEPNTVYTGYDIGVTTAPVVTEVTISGQVILYNAGNPLNGVVVEAYENGTTATGIASVTNPSGYYSITLPSPWTGTLEVSKAGYSQYGDSS